jgi:REP element-mobilizing transposase RayT
MPVRRQILHTTGTYFITFTCYKWIKLIEFTNAYQEIYRCLDHLRNDGHLINGYVIMPNHVHLLISFMDSRKPINSIIGELKRFLAYYIINSLKENNQLDLLNQLSIAVNNSQRKINKKHEVFEPSFDWKECKSSYFIHQKLDYIHYNPCRSNPPLAYHPCDYPYSSARNYFDRVDGFYRIDII